MPSDLRKLLQNAALCATAGCSVFPAASKPPSVVESVHAEYDFAAGAPRAIEVPASGEDLTVLELVVEPPPRGERFERGRRILLLPSDCERADLRCRMQRWAHGDEADLTVPAGTDLFPGARSVRFVDQSQP
ncbi:MAG: hypothetical protein R3F56_06485 [Planctomycetota bacterium]